MSKQESRVIKKDFSGLNKLRRSIKKQFTTRVGILGAKVSRGTQGDDGENKESDSLNNAEIGVIHEFGSVKRNIPPRSFLRVPLKTKADEIVKNVLKKRRIIEEDMIEGEGRMLYETLGVAAEGIVLESFDSSGFGKWPKLKKVRKDGTSTPLVHTAQLKKSITTDVIEGD